jgi:hypothetical protein
MRARLDSVVKVSESGVFVRERTRREPTKRHMHNLFRMLGMLFSSRVSKAFSQIRQVRRFSNIDPDAV